MKARVLKYTVAFFLPASALVALTAHGWLTFLPVIYAFLLVPVLEWITGSGSANLAGTERELARKDSWYDLLLYLAVPIQLALLLLFLSSVGDAGISPTERTGRILSMGLMCGVFGINVGHELGHRVTRGERKLALILLASSLYMHFMIEHNRGHHRNVGTPLDPASAKRGEAIYFFWIRTLTMSLFSAAHIVAHERKRKNQAIWSLRNEFIQYMAIEFILCFAIGIFAGIPSLLCFLAAAVLGMLLLETVNYVEHYGLRRSLVSAHRYQDVKPEHSWNSDFVLGRLVLFELTRHSDHHGDPSQPYQVLDSIPGSPQLPAGYPAMMLLALVPPLWFHTMDPRIPQMQE